VNKRYLPFYIVGMILSVGAAVVFAANGAYGAAFGLAIPLLYLIPEVLEILRDNEK
jgi:membrane associated rhomboid family serine protease